MRWSEPLATGAPRFIEVAVAPAGSGDYVVLAPRGFFAPWPQIWVSEVAHDQRRQASYSRPLGQ